jgi:uncharacterized protein YukE
MANNVVIKVTPAELEPWQRRSVLRLRTMLSSILTFSDVDGMANAWKGKDNTAFTNQIKGFLDDFQSMKALLEEYAAFLDKSANAYEQTRTKLQALLSACRTDRR